MPVSEHTYRQVASEDREGHWKLHGGFLRRKPEVTLEHNQIASELFFSLRQQLDRRRYDVRANRATSDCRHRTTTFPTCTSSR